ncbi:MAG: LURP-one-related family protein [Halobacteria archaeon]|nr:LURP-one-related family protein [Halobacteria archaeon]
MAQTTQDVISGVDLTDDSYTVKQKLFRNKYKIYDKNGNLVVRTKQKLLKMKEEFPFTDPDGNELFTIKAQNMFDIAGDYALTEAGDEEPFAVLGKNFTFFKHSWTVKDPQTDEVWAKIESRSALVEALRSLSSLFSLFPHKYTVETPNGEHLGVIQGKFSLADEYEITIENSGDAPKEALVASCIAIDALEGN